MKVISEIALRDFKFWSGGKDRAKHCSDEQLDFIEPLMKEIAPEDGWTEDEINNFFWFEFDTIADWLDYEDEEHFCAGVSKSDVKEAEDWFNCILDADEMIAIANLDRENYISKNEDEEEEFDEDSVYDDFLEWWNDMRDIEQVREYRKHNE